MFLLFTLKPIIRRRDIKETRSDFPVSTGYGNGLNKKAEQTLRRMMFGPDRGAVDSAGMKRLFKSTLELGIPQPGEQLSTIKVSCVAEKCLVSSGSIRARCHRVRQRH